MSLSYLSTQPLKTDTLLFLGLDKKSILQKNLNELWATQYFSFGPRFEQDWEVKERVNLLLPKVNC